MADIISNWFGGTGGTSNKAPMDDAFAVFAGVGNAVASLLGCCDASNRKPPINSAETNRIPVNPPNPERPSIQSITTSIGNRVPNKDSLAPLTSLGFRVKDGRRLIPPVSTQLTLPLQRVATQLNDQLQSIFLMIKQLLQPLHNHDPNRFKPVLRKVSRFLVAHTWECSTTQVRKPVVMVIGKSSPITVIIELLTKALNFTRQFIEVHPRSNHDSGLQWDEIGRWQNQSQDIADILDLVQRLNDEKDDRLLAPPCEDHSNSGNRMLSIDLTVATAVPISEPILHPSDVQHSELADRVLKKKTPPPNVPRLYSVELPSRSQGSVQVSVSPRPVVILPYEDPKPFVRDAISKVKHCLMSYQISTCHEELDTILDQMNTNVDSLQSSIQHRPRSLRPVALPEAIRLIDRTIGIFKSENQPYLPNFYPNLAVLNRVHGILLSLKSR